MVYTALELVIIPAIPLTMAAGVLFGVGPGLVVVSLASTAAAALAFLIARYAARDKVRRPASRTRVGADHLVRYSRPVVTHRAISDCLQSIPRIAHLELMVASS